MPTKTRANRDVIRRPRSSANNAEKTATVKKSVTIRQQTLGRLKPERLENLSQTVGESLDLLAGLDSQWDVVTQWEAKHGEIDAAKLRPFVETVIRTQAEHMLNEARWKR